MILRPPISTRTGTLFPYTTLVRSLFFIEIAGANGRADKIHNESAGRHASKLAGVVFARLDFHYVHPDDPPFFHQPVNELAGLQVCQDRKSTRLNSSH